MSKLVFVLFTVLFVSYVQCSAIDSESSSLLNQKALAERLEEAKVKLQDAKKKFDELTETLKVKGKKVAGKVKESAVRLAEEVKDAFQTILDCAKEELIPLGEKVKDEIKGLIEDIQKIQNEAGNTDLVRAERSLLEDAKGHFHKAVEQLEEAKKKLDELLNQAIEAAKVKIQEGKAVAKELIEKLKEALLQLSRQFKESLRAIIRYANQKLHESEVESQE